MKIYLKPSELTELNELYKRCREAPVMALSTADALSGNDFVSIIERYLRKRWAEIALSYGYAEKASFNSKTGEIIPEG